MGSYLHAGNKYNFDVRLMGRYKDSMASFDYSEGGRSVPPISSILKKNRIFIGLCFLWIKKSLNIVIHCGFQGKELLL